MQKIELGFFYKLTKCQSNQTETTFGANTIKQHLKKLQKIYHEKVFMCVRDMSQLSEFYKKSSPTAAPISDVTVRDYEKILKTKKLSI